MSARMIEEMMAEEKGIAENLLQGAPADYLLPPTRPTLLEAQAWCRRLATSHYENFHVATWFLPRRLRPHFESLYAFSRVSDDLGDEVASPQVALRLLTTWRQMLAECYREPGQSQHPVFVALAETIRETGVPEQLFADLIDAFRQDQSKTDYNSMAELVDYSRRSANPVGRLVLWICGYREEKLCLLSDRVCTGLQLANFWQDVAEDRARGRRYLPADAMKRHGVQDAMLDARPASAQFRAMMQALVEDAATLLDQGSAIVGEVDRELALTLRLFVQGGQAALKGVRAQRYDVLSRRPSVSKATKLRLLGVALAGKLATLLPSPARTGSRP